MKTLVLDIQKIVTLRLNIILYVLAFSIPFLISHPQLLTGTIVNSFFFIASEKLKKRQLLPILILPSLGAFSHGLLFGPLTMFLFYFLPFIWLGNFLQVSSFAFAKKQNYFARVILSALTKYLLLFIAANFYFKLNIVPKIFISAMGITQFITACLGGLLAYFILRCIKNERN